MEITWHLLCSNTVWCRVLIFVENTFLRRSHFVLCYFKVSEPLPTNSSKSFFNNITFEPITQGPPSPVVATVPGTLFDQATKDTALNPRVSFTLFKSPTLFTSSQETSEVSSIFSDIRTFSKNVVFTEFQAKSFHHMSTNSYLLFWNNTSL